MYSDGLTSAVARVNPKMVVRVNGDNVLGSEVSTHYIRYTTGHIIRPFPCFPTERIESKRCNNIASIVEAVGGLANDHVKPGSY